MLNDRSRTLGSSISTRSTCRYFCRITMTDRAPQPATRNPNHSIGHREHLRTGTVSFSSTCIRNWCFASICAENPSICPENCTENSICIENSRPEQSSSAGGPVEDERVVDFDAVDVPVLLAHQRQRLREPRHRYLYELQNWFFASLWHLFALHSRCVALQKDASCKVNRTFGASALAASGLATSKPDEPH